MYYTLTQIKEASRALDDSRRTFDCQAPRRDADKQEQSSAGVPYGTHGSAFVQVDPATGAVRCGACAGALDATAQPKTRVRMNGGRRVHLVSVVEPHHVVVEGVGAVKA